MFRIERNVQGIPGLHVAYNIMSEEQEKILFNAHAIWRGFYSVDKDRTGPGPTSPRDWPPEVFEILNAIGDTRLYEDMCPPDYMLPLHYPIGSKFASHFDSRYR
jgi:hypothetical protein